MRVFILTLIFFVAAQAEIDKKLIHSLNLNKPNGRITGGDEVEPHSLPYQVALLFPTTDGFGFCGGSLIAKNVVLTAAHYVSQNTNVTVVLGAHRILEWEDTQREIDASDIIVHPEWDEVRMVNDIALVIMEKDAVLNEAVQLVKLPSAEDADNDYLGQLGLASGWGNIQDGGFRISNVLSKVEMEIVSNVDCDVYYPGAIEPTHICTDASQSKSACGGDAGGPLVVNEVQVGVFSYGLEFSCEIGYSPVFTRVTKYIDWIQQNLKNVTSA